MAVKNDIIMSGLGEHAGYDLARFSDTARRELIRLAHENGAGRADASPAHGTHLDDRAG